MQNYWEISRLAAPEHSPQFGIFEGKKRVAIVFDEQNAKAIAAVPELLTALGDAVDFLADYASETGDFPDILRRSRRLLDSLEN